jgi:nicotinamidase-related amidase
MASNKSSGRSIAFKAHTAPSLRPHSTRAESRMFFAKGSIRGSIVTARFSTTLIAGTPGLAHYLEKRSIKEIYLMGLALDYCVKYSTLDARHLGLNTYVIVDGCRGIDLEPSDIDRALEEMKQAGAILLQTTDLRDKS